MQTRLCSLMEQLVNIGSGFLISLALWEFVIRELITLGHLSVDNSIHITLIFTITSLIRGYVFRRIFNAYITRRN